MDFYITKASGQQELFNEHKFSRSLERAGAAPATIAQLIEDIKHHPELRSTKAIYRWALGQLKQHNLPVAARYNLKQALLQLGPTGFPFEKYVAELFQAQGYKTKTDQIIKGKCVEHEVDLVFENATSYNLAECKFHNRQGLSTAIHVPLYVKARCDDIDAVWSKEPALRNKEHHAWVMTNTRFTSESKQYAKCAGLKLLSWAYPEHEALRDIIDKYGLHPITALTTLKMKQKKELISNNLVLCKDVQKHVDLLKRMGIANEKLKQVMEEAEGVCKI